MATKLFEVQNLQGQFLGAYYASSPRYAIIRFLDEQRMTASQFKGMKVPRFEELKAVEKK